METITFKNSLKKSNALGTAKCKLTEEIVKIGKSHLIPNSDKKRQKDVKISHAIFLHLFVVTTPYTKTTCRLLSCKIKNLNVGNLRLFNHFLF